MGRDPTGYIDGLSLYAGYFGMYSGVDPEGLWSRINSWTSDAGPYRGHVCAVVGDTLEKLASLITGHGEDSKVLNITDPVKVGQNIDISKLLQKLEDRLRDNIVGATGKFKAGFANKHPIQDKPGANGDYIEEYFKENTTANAECMNGAALVMAKGLIDTITKADFDALYNLSSITTHTGEGYQHGPLLFRRYITVKDVEKGDWGYFGNYENYRTNLGAWQGENVIAEGDGTFWGHGLGGGKTPKGIEDALKEEYNGSENSGRFRGWLGWADFLRVAKIGMEVFDHRNKK
jgi:hypothetical protein